MRNVGVSLRQYMKMRAGLTGRAFKTTEWEHGHQVEARLSKRWLTTAEDRRWWSFETFPDLVHMERVQSHSDPVDYILSRLSIPTGMLRLSELLSYHRAITWGSKGPQMQQRCQFSRSRDKLRTSEKSKTSDYSLSSQSLNISHAISCHWFQLIGSWWF